VLAEAGGDAVTARLHVGAEARNVRLARLAGGLELLADLVDVGLALGGELVGVLMEAGADRAAARLDPGTEAGDVGLARARGLGSGGRLLGESGTGAEQGEDEEGGSGEEATHRDELRKKQVRSFPHRTPSAG
jgi:hypothetical protein